VIILGSIYHSSRVPQKLRSSAGIIAVLARAVLAGAVLAGAVLAVARRGSKSSDVAGGN
jgi:hypothetical protein